VNPMQTIGLPQLLLIFAAVIMIVGICRLTPRGR